MILEMKHSNALEQHLRKNLQRAPKLAAALLEIVRSCRSAGLEGDPDYGRLRALLIDAKTPCCSPAGTARVALPAVHDAGQQRVMPGRLLAAAERPVRTFMPPQAVTKYTEFFMRGWWIMLGAAMMCSDVKPKHLRKPALRDPGRILSSSSKCQGRICSRCNARAGCRVAGRGAGSLTSPKE
eukprot:NODE_8380_length_1499_cov_11.236880.p1 GENE.NODE_8380_length_1499_cov_11.236880~~NODE_8380_length_1499_cov_11.236880.p1  ORF type:complete len:182 (+),score=42.64 NODE_8380_length_1499_cov_11.236880:490-1035(+)